MIDVSEYLKTLPNKNIAVFGLGKSGLASVKALVKSGSTVYAYDDNPDKLAAAKKAGAKTKELSKDVLGKCALLVLSPGIPFRRPAPHRVVEDARACDVEIIGDIELLARSGHGRTTIGVTGTNGKSTTTTLIHHILTEGKMSSVLGGNVGRPVMGLKLPAKAGAFTLELSSFQLDLCTDFAPDIAVLLNITPDHIDRHGTLAAYVNAKAGIFEKTDGAAVICIDDDYCLELYEGLVKSQPEKTVIPIAFNKEIKGGVYVIENKLIDHMEEEPVTVGSLAGLTKLNGLHNQQNAAAAYVAARLAGLERDVIFEALKTFEGLAHRQYPVRVINGVAYINDSKATNAAAAEKALKSFKNIYWIVGGILKEGGLQGLERFADRIRHAYVIGKETEEIAEWMTSFNIDFYRSGTLDIAIEQAHKHAMEERGQPGGAGVVLLSPACASFDQYESFEERGDHFTRIVEALEEKA